MMGDKSVRAAKRLACGVSALILFAALPACKRSDSAAEAPAQHKDSATSPTPTNRIDIPAEVRQNLGLTFVRVEKRPVRSTIRLPGQFEFRPEARREYHVMLPGRIELLVEQFQQLVPGQPLFYLDSPQWQRMQSDLTVALHSMKRSHADLAVAAATVVEREKAVEFLEKRLAQLAVAEVRQVMLEAELEDKRNTLPRLRAEHDAARTEFDAAHARYDMMLRTASSFTGIAVDVLNPGSDTHEHFDGHEPAWQTVDRLTVRAEALGVVDRLAVTNMGWAETGDLVLDTVDPAALRFHGDALQTDITLFTDGQRGRIVPAPGGAVDLQDNIDGTISVGFQADSQQRTIPVFLTPDELPKWGKAGVTAYLEVFTHGDGQGVLAIPEASVVADGLDSVFFRRDPADPNKVIRTKADLGASDGRWVEVRSGARLGEEVVLEGVYPLMLASSESGTRTTGGHFHADGTFHAGEEE